MQYSVRDFIRWSAEALGVSLRFGGSGTGEVAVVETVIFDRAPNVRLGQVIMRIDPRYFRPAEVETLLGDPTNAREKLGWTPQITAQEMCREMVEEDLKAARRHRLLKDHGFDLPIALEA